MHGIFLYGNITANISQNITANWATTEVKVATELNKKFIHFNSIQFKMAPFNKSLIFWNLIYVKIWLSSLRIRRFSTSNDFFIFVSLTEIITYQIFFQTWHLELNWNEWIVDSLPSPLLLPSPPNLPWRFLIFLPWPFWITELFAIQSKNVFARSVPYCGSLIKYSR